MSPQSTPEQEPGASREEKTQALEAVLRSETFARAEQLRTFLRYVCEREIAGRAHEISEYAIGVEVLGRPEGYSSAEDSSVRKRAYELRQRLERLYSAELSGARLRIQIPKGSYVPRFVALPASGNAAAEFDAGPGQARARAGWRGPWWTAAIAGAALCAGFAAAWFLRPAAGPAAIDRVVAEAWGPMARPRGDVVICIATNLHLLVRPYADKQGFPQFEAFPQLYDLFRKHRPLPEGVRLTMLPADASVTFGEVGATVLASSTLRSFGVAHQILPEAVAPYATLRKRNAVAIGVPIDSLVVSRLLAQTPFTVDYSAAAADQAILDRRGGGKVAYEAGRGVAYGLLTVLPSEGAVDEPAQTVVFSGIGSVGAQAAAEFFSSPAELKNFKTRLSGEGLKTLPRAYQVVIRCRASESLLVSYEYASHAVIAR